MAKENGRAHVEGGVRGSIARHMPFSSLLFCRPPLSLSQFFLARDRTDGLLDVPQQHGGGEHGIVGDHRCLFQRRGGLCGGRVFQGVVDIREVLQSARHGARLAMVLGTEVRQLHRFAPRFRPLLGGGSRRTATRHRRRHWRHWARHRQRGRRRAGPPVGRSGVAVLVTSPLLLVVVDVHVSAGAGAGTGAGTGVVEEQVRRVRNGRVDIHTGGHIHPGGPTTLHLVVADLSPPALLGGIGVDGVGGGWWRRGCRRGGVVGVGGGGSGGIRAGAGRARSVARYL
mmetsp:Transcript_41538/g.96028  ORF Transcript_41538/g.96028 Transcript_41538/m.96028 type:complete len:284 (-) Transcript_41538:25-876(-)